MNFWPKVKRAIEFAWVPGGWDANRDGPNPLCGIYYLGALRAAQEMAKAAGDEQSAAEYGRVFESGKKWIDANLFNGDYYVQRIEGRPAREIAPGLRSGMGEDDSEHPQSQVGDGCLVDQLLGQYLADVAGLGLLVDRTHIQRTLESI